MEGQVYAQVSAIPPILGRYLGKSSSNGRDLFRVDMKVILAEEEKVQAGGRTHQLSTSPSTPVHQQRSTSGDDMRVAFSLPNKRRGEPALHPSSPGRSRAAPAPTSTSTLAWRSPSRSVEPSSSGLSPGRAASGQMLSRTPPGSTQVSADATRVSFSLPKTSGALPPSSTPGISRAASTSASDQRRNPPASAEPPNLRTPPSGSGSRRAQEDVSVTPAPPLRKSRSAQSAPVPGPSTPTLMATARPGLGPVINPSKAKAGLTATRYASYVHPPFFNSYRHRRTTRLAVLTYTPHATVGIHGSCLRTSLAHTRPPARRYPSPRSSSCRASHITWRRRSAARCGTYKRRRPSCRQRQSF